MGKQVRTTRKGVALMVVLFVIITLTALSVGFLSQRDVEMSSGNNMSLRAQMDYLAESGLDHARGILLNPMGIDTGGSDYWTGATRQQITSGTDYYDVNVTKISADMMQTEYLIECTAYREDGVQTHPQQVVPRIGQSYLSAGLIVASNRRIAIAVSDKIEVKNSGQINIIDGTANISTNSTVSKKIHVKDDGIIDCDVFIGVGGDISRVIKIEGNGQITGSQLVLTSPEVLTTTAIPDLGSSVGDLSYESGTTTISSNIHCKKFTVKNNAIVNISGDVVIVADDDFKVQDDGQIRILDGGSLTLHSTEKITVEHRGQVNVNTADPTKFTVYHSRRTNLDTFTIKGTSKFYATVFSLEAGMTISSYGEFFGTFRGKEIKVEQNGKLHGLLVVPE